MTEIVWCANDCSAEATRMVCHEDGRATPLCEKCADAYEWGQTSPKAEVQAIEWVRFKKEGFTYTWLAEETDDG